MKVKSVSKCADGAFKAVIEFSDGSVKEIGIVKTPNKLTENQHLDAEFQAIADTDVADVAVNGYSGKVFTKK